MSSKIYEKERNQVPSESMDRILALRPRLSRSNLLTSMRVHLACYEPVLSAVDADVLSCFCGVCQNYADQIRRRGVPDMTEAVKDAVLSVADRSESYLFQQCERKSKLAADHVFVIDGLEPTRGFDVSLAGVFIHSADSVGAVSPGIETFNDAVSVAARSHPEVLLAKFRSGKQQLGVHALEQMGISLDSLSQEGIVFGNSIQNLQMVELRERYRNAGVAFDPEQWQSSSEPFCQGFSEQGITPDMMQVFLTDRLLQDARECVYAPPHPDAYKKACIGYAPSICEILDRCRDRESAESPGTRFVVNQVSEQSDGFVCLDLSFACDLGVPQQIDVKSALSAHCTNRTVRDLSDALKVSHVESYPAEDARRILDHCNTDGDRPVFCGDFYKKSGNIVVDTNSLWETNVPFCEARHEAHWSDFHKARTDEKSVSLQGLPQISIFSDDFADAVQSGFALGE